MGVETAFVLWGAILSVNGIVVWLEHGHTSGFCYNDGDKISCMQIKLW